MRPQRSSGGGARGLPRLPSASILVGLAAVVAGVSLHVYQTTVSTLTPQIRDPKPVEFWEFPPWPRLQQIAEDRMRAVTSFAAGEDAETHVHIGSLHHPRISGDGDVRFPREFYSGVLYGVSAWNPRDAMGEQGGTYRGIKPDEIEHAASGAGAGGSRSGSGSGNAKEKRPARGSGGGTDASSGGGEGGDGYGDGFGDAAPRGYDPVLDAENRARNEVLLADLLDMWPRPDGIYHSVHTHLDADAYREEGFVLHFKQPGQEAERSVLALARSHGQVCVFKWWPHVWGVDPEEHVTVMQSLVPVATGVRAVKADAAAREVEVVPAHVDWLLERGAPGAIAMPPLEAAEVADGAGARVPKPEPQQPPGTAS